MANHPQSIYAYAGKLSKIPAICAFILAFACSASAYGAAIATVDQFDGYSNRVLEKIVDKWAPPAVDGAWLLRLQISLDDTGKAIACKVLHSSGHASVDNYACQAFRNHAAFGTPPYGMPVETYFAIWSENKKPAAKNAAHAAVAKEHGKAGEAAEADRPALSADSKYKKYLEASAKKIRNSIYIPEKTKPGVYHATARIKCDSKGKILSSSIVEGSGDSLLDKYILQGIKRAGKISAPPAGLGDSFDLTFTLRR